MRVLNDRRKTLSDRRRKTTKNHLTGILGGAIWCVGMSFSIIASGKAGTARLKVSVRAAPAARLRGGEAVLDAGDLKALDDARGGIDEGAVEVEEDGGEGGCAGHVRVYRSFLRGSLQWTQCIQTSSLSAHSSM